ncbi:MAG: recombinase family protein [Actinomycetota bacterium]|nr:recombinase family protein [Actinomycetota bacterium]
MRAAIYARISQDRVGAGLGVARQRLDCEKLITTRGWELVEVYEDNDISAYSGKFRAGYRRLLDDIVAGHVQAVVAWHTDRLHRSPRELEEWIDACERHDVLTVTVRAGELDLATAAGRMVARMLGAAARHESEQKSERVRRAREQAAMAGKFHGNMGFGYRRDPAGQGWLLDLTQAAIVKEVADRILAGESLRSIATDLNVRNVPSPAAARYGWRAPNMRQMITSGRFCGWREWSPLSGGRRAAGSGELVAQGDWPAILTRQETERLRLLLFDPSRRTGRAVRNLLSSILQCGRCGAPMSAQSWNEHTARRYACVAQPGLSRCGGLTVSALAVERHVLQMLFAALENAPLRSTAPPPHERVLEEGMLASLEADRLLLDGLAVDLAEGRITRGEWLRVREVVAARIDKATAGARLNQQSALVRRLPTDRKSLAGAWERLNLTEQRAVVLAVMEKIVVMPALTRGPVFNPERLIVTWRA